MIQIGKKLDKKYVDVILEMQKKDRLVLFFTLGYESTEYINRVATGDVRVQPEHIRAIEECLKTALPLAIEKQKNLKAGIKAINELYKATQAA